MEVNNIYNIDAVKGMRELEDDAVDLVLTDPPYGVNLEYDEYEDSKENWFALLEKTIPEMKRVGKMVIFPAGRVSRLEWYYRNFPPDWMIAWYKGSPGQRAYIGFQDWEPHLVYGKTRSDLKMHDFFQTRASHKKQKFKHPCAKPIEWAYWLIKKSTKEGDLVLDPFVGSGTTAKAASSLEREYLGFDISEDYCKLARTRLSQVQKSLIKT